MDPNLDRILDTPVRDLQKHELRIVEDALNRVYVADDKTIGEALRPAGQALPEPTSPE